MRAVSLINIIILFCNRIQTDNKVTFIDQWTVYLPTYNIGPI